MDQKALKDNNKLYSPPQSWTAFQQQGIQPHFLESFDLNAYLRHQGNTFLFIKSKMELLSFLPYQINLINTLYSLACFVI